MYKWIDIFRWLMSLLVIAIHVNIFFPVTNSIGVQLFEDITGIAVPFFFITSGYFFVVSGAVERRQNYLLKLFKTYIMWTVIYLPFTFFYYIVQQQYNVFQTFLYFMQRILLVGENYYSFHLWYIHGLIFCVVLYVILLKILKPQNKKMSVHMFIFAFALYVGGRALSFVASQEKLYPIISYIAKQYMNIFITTRNGPLFGFCFFMIGVMFSQHQKICEIIKKRICVVVFCVTAILNHLGCFFLLPLEVAALWILILKLRADIQIDTKIFRKASEMNYYVHMYPVSLFAIILPKQADFFFVLIICVLITIIVSGIYIGSKILRTKR